MMLRSDAAVSRRDVRDLWRAAARAHEKNGEPEQAEQCRETAKLWGDGMVRNWRGQVIWRR
jgi:hypothetical protein